ncbi:hypothetical protein AwWohl_12550 [Gammaproteobacteria bacterium]|nr:hypothetical protein AwWohl_12550 [Gammaproteobacteria bacterium]
MIIMRLVLDNIASFKHAEFNFSYPRKIKDSTIDYEYLEGRENFRFKRVNILMGANASGKTMFGRILCDIRTYISKGALDLCDLFFINDNADSFFELDFVDPAKHMLYRIHTRFNIEGILEENLYSVKIAKSDSYEKAVEKLVSQDNKIYDKNNLNADSELISKNTKIFIQKRFEIQLGWLLLFSESTFTDYDLWDGPFLKKDILEKILISFDESIKTISPIEGTEGKAFLITFKNGDIVTLTNGELSNKQRLSSGTYESIRAVLMASLIQSRSEDLSPNSYFIDELIPHAHTEMEQAILNLYIGLLGRNSQLFYTTHNYDILEMNLPLHSYMFFKKDIYTEIIYPATTYKKNDRNLINAVKNDVFKTVPDTHLISDLLV